MSAALLTALLSFAPPPPPPGPEGAKPESTEPEASGETEVPPPPEDPAPSPSEDGAPEGSGEPAEGSGEPAEPELDERNDPILDYAESAPEGDAVQFAEDSPPAPELPFAEESTPADELEYGQTNQRPSPPEEALERESDEANDLGKSEFQGREESPQRFAVELKFGPYLPNVDKRATGDLGPYATVFGETNDAGEATGQPRKGLFSVLGFEWQFVHLGGPLSLGTTIGFFRDSADAIVTQPLPDAETIRSSADRAAFNVVPVTLLLGYRFELLADRFRVPLVPYARAGIGYGFWIATKGEGNDRTTNAAGQGSRGGSWGWQANLGLMLRLDIIERAAGLELDRTAGINHTYVFGEWQFSRLDGFGSDTAMVVGDDTFLVGLAVEF